MPQSLPIGWQALIGLNTGLLIPFLTRVAPHLPFTCLPHPACPPLPWSSHVRAPASSPKASCCLPASLFCTCPTIPTETPSFLDQCLLKGSDSFQPKLFNMVYPSPVGPSMLTSYTACCFFCQWTYITFVNTQVKRERGMKSQRFKWTLFHISIEFNKLNWGESLLPTLDRVSILCTPMAPSLRINTQTTYHDVL